ncbi:hypothetical protein IVB30_41000 [Bradyrhizobium sp. 200]|uniref:hypothetical protein n=1 Tax=Bradyrhizobium sp. 200 TaxID=2782665 RepID=UPI001FFF5559|nr:hypothetical protein [Bradyrhizobium sp. 200]UPJ49262.1 hypothetical protein IVB30_41000 [Bradyrhizobium sp. 200]
MAEFFIFLRDMANAPQVQIWLMIGLIAGTIYGRSRFRRPDSLLLTTAMVIGPSLIYFALFNSVGMNAITLILTLIFGMLGFLGFSLGWLPGVLMGCVLGLLIARNRINQPRTSED